MSVATASAVLGSRLTRTISRALPRTTAAIAQAHPTLPVPTIPIFMDISVCHAVDPPMASLRARARGGALLARDAGRLEQEPGAPLSLIDPVFDQACAGHVVVLVAN